MAAPPTPLRIGMTACLLASSAPTIPTAQLLKKHLRAWHLPFAAMALCFILHAPALRAASSCDATAALRLAEHATYYALLHASLLAAMELGGAPPAGVWTTLAYLALFYAWHMHAAARRIPNCTLSPLLFSCACLAFCAGCIGLAVQAPADAIPAHFAAWVLADACAFLFSLFFHI